ncbi:MAG: hypothetical protein DYG92_11640 [Leptolyngbya sp. PLA1]|nr:hypothetical protein [Leptolyngbya sp. PLA1]
MPDAPDQLIAEGRLLTRYVLGRTPPDDAASRYAAAVRARLDSKPLHDPIGAAAVRRPLMLPLLDAACGVVAPSSPLRARLLVAAAVTETLPQCAHEYLPRPMPRATLLLSLLAAGTTAALKLVVGLPLYFLLGGRRDRPA